MGRLAEEAFGFEQLRRAWGDVLANDADDGVLSHGVRRFEEDLDNELGRLATDLEYGTFSPSDLFETELPNEDRVRTLHIPSIRDRVLERSILDVVTPLVDPHLGPWSYAYRPGLGVRHAVQALAEAREEGLAWVLRTDVDDCFPNTPVDTAARLLGAIVGDAQLMDVVRSLLARSARSPTGRRYVPRGLPEGSPLSPLLSNLVLAGVDARTAAEGFSPVRYADDIAIPAASPEEAWEAARVLTRELEVLDMQLGEDKTQVMDFDRGFVFLGEDFGPRYPPLVSADGIDEPERKSVYVALQGGRVRMAKGRLIVETPDDTEVLELPSSRVGRLVCFGSVGVSAGTRSWAMLNGVDVVFASRRGSYTGCLVGLRDRPKAERLRAQLDAASDPRLDAVRRAIVEAKLIKQTVLLRRFGRREQADEVREATSDMEALMRLLPDATGRDEMMGLEGAAARVYWPAYGGLFLEDLQFESRSRQPPLDLANSALGFLYTVMLGEAVTACWAAGLDPLFGVLHADDDRRPSLALDLLEEFRPWVVDQVVLRAARAQRLSQEHARTEPGKAGVLLTKAGREVVLHEYEARMLTVTKGALVGVAGSLRRHLHVQAQRRQRDRRSGPTLDGCVSGVDDGDRGLRRERGRPSCATGSAVAECGDRIQKSVFLLQIEPEDLDEVMDSSAEIIDPDSDSIYAIRNCSACWDDVQLLGQAAPPAKSLFWAAL
ncbi:MAG: CRISPR-associated endonuclease Cas1 [Nocardioides sp.]